MIYISEHPMGICPQCLPSLTPPPWMVSPQSTLTWCLTCCQKLSQTTENTDQWEEMGSGVIQTWIQTPASYSTSLNFSFTSCSSGEITWHNMYKTPGTLSLKMVILLTLLANQQHLMLLTTLGVLKQSILQASGNLSSLSIPPLF